jgi:hypothetical protein
MVCTVSSTVNSSRACLRSAQAEVQLAAALDHVLEHLVDRVLIDARPTADHLADRFPDLDQELRRRHVLSAFRRVREQAAQVAVVETRIAPRRSDGVSSGSAAAASA